MEKKNESNSDIRLKGQLKNYMQWPLYMDVLLIIVSIFCCVLDMRRGLLLLMLVLIYTAILSIFYIFNQPLIIKDLMEFASEYGDVQKTVLKELTFPYALIMEDGRIVWTNICHRLTVLFFRKKQTRLRRLKSHLARKNTVQRCTDFLLRIIQRVIT